MIKYQILPPLIKRGVNSYKLIDRKGMIAFYEQCRSREPNLVTGFVVARLRHEKPTRLPNGKLLPYRERFPSPSTFGRYGWFYMAKSRDMAHAHYQDLVKKYGDSIPPKKSFNPESEGATHFEDEDDLNGGDGIVA